MVTGYNAKDFARKAKKVMVDVDKNEVEKSRVNLDQKLVCDAKYFKNSISKFAKKN